MENKNDSSVRQTAVVIFIPRTRKCGIAVLPGLDREMRKNASLPARYARKRAKGALCWLFSEGEHVQAEAAAHNPK